MAMRRWLLIDAGARTGAFHTAKDEMLARSLERSPCGVGEPALPPQEEEPLQVLRLYRWQPWAISLGYNQTADAIDLERCRADHIDVVRRPTGGRAILHAEELTYCVAMYAGTKSVMAVYNDISRALGGGAARRHPDTVRRPRSAAGLGRARSLLREKDRRQASGHGSDQPMRRTGRG